jgi:glutamine synthetase
MTSNSTGYLNVQLTNQFMNLPQGDKVQVEYVWIGGSGMDLRCKTRTLDTEVTSISQLPIWNFDGSSTDQAPGNDSEVLLHPKKIYRDPFRGGKNILVMSSCYYPNGKPVATNHRHKAEDVMAKAKSHEPWFGIEQEYTMFNVETGRPLGWPARGFPGPQGPYYCSVGADVNFGRQIVEAHYRACLFAGVKIAGINAEVLPGQWEFQVGPCEGNEVGDDLWMARYLLLRVAEIYNVNISFDPKPISGNWNGSGCHTNYSTKAMRAPKGYPEIIKAIKKLEKVHEEHIAVYGVGNERRLLGSHETASIDQFSYGVADRGASIRIPRQTEKDQCGYFEDRRPASNIDPYLVSAKIVETTILK